MGNLFTKAKEYRILMSGLDAAGKTTILYRLKLGEVVTTIPTISFNLETVTHNNISLTMWDVGMRDKSRPLMRHYYPNTQALFLVVDSSDRERLEDVKDILDMILKEEELRDAPLAVLCNKQDLASAMSVPELTEYLELHKVRQNCGVFATSATTGEGLQEVLNWLVCTLTDDQTAGLNLDRNTNSTETIDVSHSTQDYFWKGWEVLKKMFIT